MQKQEFSHPFGPNRVFHSSKFPSPPVAFHSKMISGMGERGLALTTLVPCFRPKKHARYYFKLIQLSHLAF